MNLYSLLSIHPPSHQHQPFFESAPPHGRCAGSAQDPSPSGKLPAAPLSKQLPLDVWNGAYSSIISHYLYSSHCLISHYYHPLLENRNKPQQTPSCRSCPSIKPSPPSNRNGLHHKMGPRSKTVWLGSLVVQAPGGEACHFLHFPKILHVLLMMEMVHDFCHHHIGLLCCLSSPEYSASMSPATGMLRCSAHVTSASQAQGHSVDSVWDIGMEQTLGCQWRGFFAFGGSQNISKSQTIHFGESYP